MSPETRAAVRLSPELLDEARELGGHANRREAAEAALREYVTRRRRTRIVDFFGTVEFCEGFEPRAARAR